MPHHDTEELCVFQIVTLPEKEVLVDTYLSRSDGGDEKCFTVQPLEVFGPAPRPDDTLEVFILREPCKIDLIDIVGPDHQKRGHSFVFKHSG